MQLRNARILVIDDDVDVLTALRLLLKAKVKEVVTEKNPNNITAIVKPGRFDLVILDMNFTSLINTGNEGIFWLNKIKLIDPKLQVALITAYGDIDLAIRSLKEGAADFIVKPWKNEKLVQIVSEIIKSKVSSQNLKLNINVEGNQIVGESEAMQEVFIKVNKVAPTDANVLILGENGTGKDLLAKAIHENSNRKNGPFIKVDIGSLSSTLFESELFGYKKGAFTDAREERKGRFEIADGGTLFLDEIANIPLNLQSKLLSVLQNRQVIPLGSNTPVNIDIRLICATNVNLASLANEEKFRKDLIYRINTVEMELPPLRYRDNDIIILTRYFVKLYTDKYLKSKFILHPSFIKKISEYQFPGNVRELQYIIERAVIMADTNELLERDLVFSPIEKYMQSDTLKSHNLDEVEKSTIVKVLEKNNGNISKSAKELGITRTALYRRLEKYGI